MAAGYLPTRVKIALVLMAAAGLGIFVALAFIGGGSSGCTTPDAIVSVMPDCNESVFQQAPIQVEVANGYRAELVLNGQQIPADELTTNIASDDTNGPGVGAAPTVFTFLPGEGKSIEQLGPNQNCATARYWPITSSIAEARSFTWCFRAA